MTTIEVILEMAKMKQDIITAYIERCIRPYATYML